MKIFEKEYAVRLFEELYITEYEATLDEGWTVDNESLEANLYLGLSEEGKKVYAMNHAKQYAQEVMQWHESKFFDWYGDQFDLVIN